MTNRFVAYDNGVMSLETWTEDAKGKPKFEKRETLVRVVYADDALRHDIASWLQERLRAEGRLHDLKLPEKLPECVHDYNDFSPCGWCGNRAKNRAAGHPDPAPEPTTATPPPWPGGYRDGGDE